jgi:hypothetical protein
MFEPSGKDDEKRSGNLPYIGATFAMKFRKNCISFLKFFGGTGEIEGPFPDCGDGSASVRYTICFQAACLS